MKCPNCNEVLQMSNRQGVEIDYCPNCRGVWLDRGELDKIIERSAQYTEGSGDALNTDTKFDSRQQYPPQQYPSQQYPPQQGGNYNDPYYKNDPHYKHKKKKGFLGDLFDFD